MAHFSPGARAPLMVKGLNYIGGMLSAGSNQKFLSLDFFSSFLYLFRGRNGHFGTSGNIHSSFSLDVYSNIQ